MDTTQVSIRTGPHTITAETNATLMEAMLPAGLLLRSDCGGRGRCGKCVVQVESAAAGALSAPDEAERQSLGRDRLLAGSRLACRARVLGPLAFEIPAESRLAPEVVQKGLPVLLPHLGPPPAARPGQAAWGLAIDVGTTTIAVYLCDLGGRAVAASTSVRNPQSLFGDDVISRISAVRVDPRALPRLQHMVANAVDWAAAAVCREVRLDPRRIESVVAVGNPTMVHLLLGEDPSPIGVFPYAPNFLDARELSAGEAGLQFNPAARMHTLPLISGYLGADIVGAALAADFKHSPTGCLLVDVGTNGEIMLKAASGLAATSCATGPALEGAAIRHGMQAASGAIDAVRFNPQEGRLDYTVIRRDPGRPKRPAGICGSGVISTVAELLRAGILSPSGRFNADRASPCLRAGADGVLEFEIVAAHASHTGRPITLTQADIRAVQLAKGALRTGIDLLCRENAMERPARIFLAGAFGSFINRSDALRLGMFPQMAEAEIEVAGNAAGAGAVLALFSEEHFTEATRLARSTRVFDLAAHPDFQETFINCLSFA